MSSQHVEYGAMLTRAEAQNTEAEQGTCALCGQVMLRTDEDCWHPWSVLKPCPEEPSSVPWDIKGWLDFRRAGLSSHRPGREHFVPDEPDPAKYCSIYCAHNAAGACTCPPCVFLRTETGFEHAPNCPRTNPTDKGM